MVEPARGKTARQRLGEHAEARASRKGLSKSLGRGQREGRSGGGASGGGKARRRRLDRGGARGGAAASYAKAPPAWPACRERPGGGRGIAACGSLLAGSIEKSRVAAAASEPEQRSRHQPAARRAVRAPERRAVASGLRDDAGGPRAARRAGGAGRGSRGAHGPGA